MSSISNQLSGYGGIPSGCGSSINGRKLPEGTLQQNGSSNGVGASSTSPSGNSSSSFNSHSNLNSNNHHHGLNSSSPSSSSYPHSSYYSAAAAAAATPAELAMYGHLNAFTSHHHRSSHHHSSSVLQKPKAKARSNAGKTEYFSLFVPPDCFVPQNNVKEFQYIPKHLFVDVFKLGLLSKNITLYALQFKDYQIFTGNMKYLLKVLNLIPFC